MPNTLPSIAYPSASVLFLQASVSDKSSRYSWNRDRVKGLLNITSGSWFAVARIFIAFQYSLSSLIFSTSMSIFGYCSWNLPTMSLDSMYSIRLLSQIVKTSSPLKSELPLPFPPSSALVLVLPPAFAACVPLLFPP